MKTFPFHPEMKHMKKRGKAPCLNYNVRESFVRVNRHSP